MPLNIVTAQSHVLEKFLKLVDKQADTVEGKQTDNIEDKHVDKVKDKQTDRINGELEDVEKGILENYKDLNHVTNNSSISMRHMFDPISNSYYKYSGVDENTHEITEVIQKFEKDVSLQHLLELSLSHSYTEIYNELYDTVYKQYKLRLSSESNLREEHKLLETRKKNLTNSCNKIREVINTISHVINYIKDEKFVEEVYNHLLFNIAERATVSKEFRIDYDCRLLNKFMEYVVSGKKEPNIDMVSLLIMNGASLLHSYVTDSTANQSITVAQHFTNNLKGKYTTIVNKSIYTLMKDMHRKLFDFSITENGIDLMDIVSSIPSKDGSFGKNIENIYVFKAGQEGAQEFMHLLQNSIDKYVQKKQSSTSKDMWLKRLRVRMFGGSNINVSSQDYKDACQKLYESLNIGYLAIVTGDNKVIIDYVQGIEYEMRNAQNPMIRELYGDFLKLLEEYQELPKSIFLYKWYYYTYRTVKSYTLEWSPAWEKVLTQPRYHTNVGEWSKKKFDEIQAIEQKLASDKCIQLEQENQKCKEEELEAQKKAQEAEEQARQEAAERHRAEEQARQAEEQARQEAAERQKAEEGARKAEQRVTVMRIFSEKVSNLKGRDLRVAVNNSADRILTAILQSNLPEEEALNIIMDQVTYNKKQIVKDGKVNEIFFQKVCTLLSDVTVSSSMDIGKE